YRAKVLHFSSFVWSDGSQDLEFPSTTANQFSVRASGGARFVSAVDTNGVPTAGVQLAPGGGGWIPIGSSSSSSGLFPTMSGGYQNNVSGDYSTIGGGRNNNANAEGATVAGGTNNFASGTNSVIGGGRYNRATGDNT
ncbi:MAG: hypothetical protein L0Z53_12330, partial [Acidobacteriales bacterium]|nr:hypothetical protein [Terriglobales bacterium]